jgi:hypothetical protein
VGGWLTEKDLTAELLLDMERIMEAELVRIREALEGLGNMLQQIILLLSVRPQQADDSVSPVLERLWQMPSGPVPEA